jgi:hypothetical protein
VSQIGRFGEASTRARIYSEHSAAEKDEVRYPSFISFCEPGESLIPSYDIIEKSTD